MHPFWRRSLSERRRSSAQPKRCRHREHLRHSSIAPEFLLLVHLRPGDALPHRAPPPHTPDPSDDRRAAGLPERTAVPRGLSPFSPDAAPSAGVIGPPADLVWPQRRSRIGRPPALPATAPCATIHTRWPPGAPPMPRLKSFVPVSYFVLRLGPSS